MSLEASALLAGQDCLEHASVAPMTLGNRRLASKVMLHARQWHNITVVPASTGS